MNRDQWEALVEALTFIVMTIVLCLLVWAPPAHSEEKCIKWCILPPVEFDHPFPGTVKIEIVAARDDLKGFCGGAFKAGLTLGCSRRNGDICHIVLVQENVIKEQGWTKELMLRHEIGHCNGWAGDHPGQRVFNAK